MRRIGPRLNLALRALAALAAVGVVVWRVGPAQLAFELSRVSIPWFMATIAALLAGSAFRILNWQSLIRRFRNPDEVGYVAMADCYFAGGLMGYALPSTAGTDAIRSLLAMRSFGGDVARYMAVAVTLAGVTFLSSALLGLLGVLLLGPEYWGMRLVRLAGAICLLMVAGLTSLYLLLHFRRRALARLFRFMPRWTYGVRRRLRRFVTALRLSDDRQGGPLGLLGGSLGASVFLSIALACSGEAAGVDLDLRVWMVLLPLISIGAFVPASVSGFGFDQAVMIYLLAPFGVAAQQAFAASALIALSWISIYCTIGFASLARHGAWRGAFQRKEKASDISV